MQASVFTRISEKGQATIPIDIRHYLNIQVGDYVVYEIDSKGQVIISKARINIEPPNIQKLKKPPLKKLK